MKVPEGFEIAGLTAGIKESGRPDLAVIYAPSPVAWALTTTTNLVQAPCVTRNRSRYASGMPVRAVVVNSGNANCATGEHGTWDNEEFAAAAAVALGIDHVHQVLTASTGVIGRRLPLAPLIDAMQGFPQALSDDGTAFADAILTTDTVAKQARATLPGGATVVGIAKGSGMIHPNMATLLAFVMTDADVSQETLRRMWPGVVQRSFNQLTVDGDTSTNDSFVLIATGHAGNPRIVGEGTAEFTRLAECVLEVAQVLSQAIVRDGEGATKFMTIVVEGGATREECLRVGKSIAHSPLVKTAFFASDPNLGRILCAVGNGGVPDLDPAKVTLHLGDVLVAEKGGRAAAYTEAQGKAVMAPAEITVRVGLGRGVETATVWTCDFSYDYVKINADYRS